MIYHLVCNKSSNTGATCEAGTADLSENLGSPKFWRVSVVRTIVFCVVFSYICVCPSVFVGHCVEKRVIIKQ
jgi:hypothetical protein